MAWEWGPSNWLWQIVHTDNHFNPFQILNPTTAKSWYADHSAANWQSGTFGGKTMAVVQDCIGGYVASWTGSPASTAQGWWAAGWTVPTFFIGGGWGKAISYTSNIRSSYAALCTATDALSGGTPVDPVEGAFQILGLGGSLAGSIGGRLPGMTFADASGQLSWGFGSAKIVQTGKILEGVVDPAISTITYGQTILSQTGQTIKDLAGEPSAPEVGGILFENCAAELTDVGQITGAYWDDVSGAIVLLGRQGNQTGSVPLALPRMDRDHLAVALRAYLAGQAIGVSIDPPAKYRERARQDAHPPDGTPMLVSYLGNTEKTLFGAIMFEADRLLKCLCKGVDNVKKSPIRASVPGFRTLLEMLKPGDGQQGHLWHRFWFVIDRIALKREPHGKALAFHDVRLKVLTELEKEGVKAGESTDPMDQAFCQHLTTHYDEYAKDFPILARLKELAKVAAVARLLCRESIDLDLGRLYNEHPHDVETPSSTPGIRVVSPNVDVRQTSTGTTTRTVSLFGGVDIDCEPQLLPDDGSARQLRSEAEAARPNDGAYSWSFHSNGATMKARAVRIGQPRTPFRRSYVDHEFHATPANKIFLLRRMYDSTYLSEGDFGPGWSLWIPFSLTIISPSGKRSEVLTHRESKKPLEHPILILHDHTKLEASLYRNVHRQDPKGPQAFCKVTSQTLGKDGLSFQYDPSNTLHAQGDYFVMESSGLKYRFDAKGRLVDVRRADRLLVRYDRRASRIVRIAGPLNQSYDVKYDKASGSRITEIQVSDGQLISYFYDHLGCLIGCGNGSVRGESYAYDTRGRLSEVRDASGKVLARNVYDDFGSLLEVAEDKVPASGGQMVRRTFSDKRVVRLEDASRTRVDFEYGPRGELSALEFRGRLGRLWRLSYDPGGRLAGLATPDARCYRFSYDKFGEVAQAVGAGGRSWHFRRDTAGRLTKVSDGFGNLTTFHYDDTGRVRTIRSSELGEWNFEYRGQVPIRAHGPSGQVRISVRRNRIRSRARTPNGVWQQCIFDRDVRLVSHSAKGVKPTRFLRDEMGNVREIQNEAGTTRYHVDKANLTLRVIF